MIWYPHGSEERKIIDEYEQSRLKPPVGSGALFCAGLRVTRHALMRFRSRARGAGCKQSDQTILNKMAEMLQRRQHIGGDNYYCKAKRCGLVFVIEGSTVVTVMKPTRRDIQRKVWKAQNNRTEP